MLCSSYNPEEYLIITYLLFARKGENTSLGKNKRSPSNPSPCDPDLLTAGYGNEAQLLLLLHSK